MSAQAMLTLSGPRRRQRPIAALVALAFAWIVLAPSLALATGKLAIGSWGLLCTADGQLKLTTDPVASLPKAPGQAAFGHLGEHCPFCHLEPTFPVLPSLTEPQAPRPFFQDLLPAAQPAPEASFEPWPPAQPRAPPTRSLDP